jgi:hypothetical protein
MEIYLLKLTKLVSVICAAEYPILLSKESIYSLLPYIMHKVKFQSFTLTDYPHIKGKLPSGYVNQTYCFKQCFGSGSGSTSFWASRIRILIHKSEVWIRIRILQSSYKNSKKNLYAFYFVTLFDFFSLKNDVNVPSKSNKQKKLC